MLAGVEQVMGVFMGGASQSTHTKNNSDMHYITYEKSIKHITSNSNFDWEFYVTHNNLEGIKTEIEAYQHYIEIGKPSKLAYCKAFDFLIILHLFEMNLVDWIIEKTNFFIRNNATNTYAIKITIPVDTNIYKFKATKNYNYNIPNNCTDIIKEMAPYHPHLVDKNNAGLLFNIKEYLIQNLDMPADRIQIIFCENRGVDIGGFFLALDQTIKQNQKHDFIVKYHSKADNDLRTALTLFLDLKINTILNYYPCFYTSHIVFPDVSFKGYEKRVHDLQKLLNLTELNEFDFALGTMFIVSSQFTNFVAHWDFIKLFNMLNKGHNYYYENAFERLLGYVFKKLELHTLYFNNFVPYAPYATMPAVLTTPSPFEL